MAISVPVESETPEKISIIDPGQFTEPVYGDCNYDGEFNVADAVMLNKYLLGSGNLTDHGKINANVDLVNEAIDTTDSLDILKLVVEMLTQADMPIKK